MGTLEPEYFSPGHRPRRRFHHLSLIEFAHIKHWTPVKFNIGKDTLEAIQKYEGRINLSTGRDELNSVFSEFARDYGFIRMGQLVAYQNNIAERQYTSLGYNADEFTKEYFDQGIRNIDPGLDDIPRQHMPITWGLSQHRRNSDDNNIKKFYNFHDEFKNPFGYLIPIHGSNFVTLLGTTSGEREKHFILNTHNLVSITYLFAFLVSQAVIRLGLIGKTPPIIDRITPREKECLTWAAAGKTAWEISCILGVSERTVVAHMENAKKRLDAKTLPQAVAIAISRGMIAI